MVRDLLDFGALVIVGQNDRIFFFFKSYDLVLKVHNVLSFLSVPSVRKAHCFYFMAMAVVFALMALTGKTMGWPKTTT
jgi:hypothetical protein